MKKLFLVCNAHLDPVWLWPWQEGATAAVATFRSAANFCEQYDGFVFCHNEALLYEWVEEYDPALFERIKKLVAAGKWHIIGGWYLQPDCNIPAGETIIRQIIAGQRYFKERFGVGPKVAINFDTFGHSRGLVQILKQCGYMGYMYMRPEANRQDLPGSNFYWEGFDGSCILAHRLNGIYSANMGKAVERINELVNKQSKDDIDVFCWGVGNHGGGPSRVDFEGLNKWMAEHPELKPEHSTPEAFFEALDADRKDYPVVDYDLRPVFVGCYTSQAKVKQLHRQMENRLYTTEKMVSTAVAQGLMEYPTEKIKEAQRELLFSEFHDILPGTTIEEGEAGSVMNLQHGLDILSKLEMRAAMALLAGQPKALPEQTPVFIFNPHPYPVTGDFTFEIMPSDQNWLDDKRNTVTVRYKGEVIPSQEEKPSVNMNLDWRKRITVHATLEPSCMNRFDCAFSLEPITSKSEVKFPEGSFVFDNGQMKVTINTETGLVDSYIVNGVEYLKPGAFLPTVCADDSDPWHMLAMDYGEKVGAFKPAGKKTVRRYSDSRDIVASAVRVVEDGPIRTVVEAELEWNHSKLVQSYILPKEGTSLEIDQYIAWNESDVILKWEIPTLVDGTYIGQGIFGRGELPMDGTECVSQKWCGLLGKEKALTVANNGIYGSHCVDGTMYLSLMRAPAYANHPIDTRKLVHEERFIPRVDQGVHKLRFVICGGSQEERRAKVDFEAQVLNEPPFIFEAFPSGDGKLPKQSVIISDPSVQLSAMYYDEEKKGYILRFWNALGQGNQVKVKLPLWNLETEITLGAFRFATYLVKDGKLEETSVI